MRPSGTSLFALYATSITICNSVTRATQGVNLLIDTAKNYEKTC